MAPLARLRLHELLKLPTDCTRGAARRLYLQEAKRCHPDAGGSEGAFIALHSAWREFSLAPPPPPVHEEIVTFVVRGDCTCGSTTAAASGCACCGGGDTGFWSAPRIEAVRHATWRAARAGGLLDRSVAAAAAAWPTRPSAAAGAGGEPTAAAAAAATVPGTLPDVHECRARLIDPEVLRLEVVADDPLSRSLLTSSLHRARHAVIESLRRALAPHGGGGARLRMRGSVTEYTR